MARINILEAADHNVVAGWFDPDRVRAAYLGLEGLDYQTLYLTAGRRWVLRTGDVHEYVGTATASAWLWSNGHRTRDVLGAWGFMGKN